MNATGIVRRIDDLGRFVIPKEIRDSRHWKTGDSFEILMDGERIVLREYKPGCKLCGKVERDLIVVKDDIRVCKDCGSRIFDFYAEDFIAGKKCASS